MTDEEKQETFLTQPEIIVNEYWKLVLAEREIEITQFRPEDALYTLENFQRVIQHFVRRFLPPPWREELPSTFMDERVFDKTSQAEYTDTLRAIELTVRELDQPKKKDWARVNVMRDSTVRYLDLIEDLLVKYGLVHLLDKKKKFGSKLR